MEGICSIALTTIVVYLRHCAEVTTLITKYPRSADFPTLITLMDFLMVPIPAIPPLETLTPRRANNCQSYEELSKFECRTRAALLYLAIHRGMVKAPDPMTHNRLYNDIQYILSHWATFGQRMRQRFWDVLENRQLFKPFSVNQSKRLTRWRPNQITQRQTELAKYGVSSGSDSSEIEYVIYGSSD